jgi:soluble lytic murein transglycosylase-like protein
MDITTDLSAVARRISEITGSAMQPPGLPGAGGIDGMPVLDPSRVAGTPFAALVQSALAGQGIAPVADAAGVGAGATAGVAIAPAMVPPEQIEKLVSANAATFNVDPDLIKAIIANESGFNANATSNVGAQGLMQLMPGTASGLGVSDAYDPAQNVWGGSKYIKGLLDRFGGDTKLAIAAYNAGPGAVEKYGGVPPYAETQNYVQNVLASLEKYRSQRR